MCPYVLSALPAGLQRGCLTYGRLIEELDGYADCARHSANSVSFQTISSANWKPARTCNSVAAMRKSSL
jgi:hypothetical protein